MKSLSFDAFLRTVCALCAAMACCGLGAAAEPSATWRMTGDGPAAEGLALLDGADGCFNVARSAGHPCARSGGATARSAWVRFAPGGGWITMRHFGQTSRPQRCVMAPDASGR